MRRTNKNSYLIVDGYNIINAWDGLKEISKEDLESAREKLIHYIIEYAQYTCGIVGTVASGLISDKLFKGSRNIPALDMGLMNVLALC